jgi:N-acyl amino acid synthase of PEP-CTERM/exosortase system
MTTAFAAAIQAASAELSVEIARTPEQILEVKQLRYRVYCEERGYEPGQDGIEQDEFDVNAHHVLVRSRATGAVLGTVRVILNKDGLGLPMQRVCEDYVLAPLPQSATVEVSRFAITRDRAGLSSTAASLMRLFLIQGLVQISGELGLTHWAAIMERTLLRLLRSTAIHFLPVGPAVEYHGLRQPAIFTLAGGLERMRLENEALWSFLTQDGTLWSEEMAGAAEEIRLAA